MENDKPIVVAQIMGKMLGGGVEACIMNYYRNIDKNKIQFDFLIDSDSTYVPREEIEKFGGRIIEIPPYQKVIKYNKELTKILKENKYEIVHSNINALSVFPLFAAWRAHIPIRIAHSHSTTNKKEWKKNLLKNCLRPFSKIFANRYLACSEHAGRWLFGNKFYDKGNVRVINNAIDVGKYRYDEVVRNDVRRELKIENKFVIGHIGRFIEQKNHGRLIEIFSEYYKINNDAVLLLIGEGKLQDDIKNKVKEMKLESSVIFLGIRNDVDKILSAMDVFLFPSLYEGLGMVLIEAQSTGLNCIASDQVPKEAKITDLVKFVGLEESNEKWAEEISLIESSKDLRENRENELLSNGYDICEEARKLENLYIQYKEDGRKI